VQVPREAGRKKFHAGLLLVKGKREKLKVNREKLKVNREKQN